MTEQYCTITQWTHSPLVFVGGPRKMRQQRSAVSRSDYCRQSSDDKAKRSISSVVRHLGRMRSTWQWSKRPLADAELFNDANNVLCVSTPPISTVNYCWWRHEIATLMHLKLLDTHGWMHAQAHSTYLQARTVAWLNKRQDTASYKHITQNNSRSLPSSGDSILEN